MFAKIKALCLHSATVGWSYCVVFLGALMSVVDQISDALGDPNLKNQIDAAIGDARMTGRILLVISVVTILARLRTLRKAG